MFSTDSGQKMENKTRISSTRMTRGVALLRYTRHVLCRETTTDAAGEWPTGTNYQVYRPVYYIRGLLVITITKDVALLLLCIRVN